MDKTPYSLIFIIIHSHFGNELIARLIIISRIDSYTADYCLG